MKVLSSMPVLFVFAICASAQVPSRSPAPGVTVIEKKWHVEVINPALEKDPFAPNKDRQQVENAQKGDARENENRVKQGEPTLAPRVPATKAETGSHRLWTEYVYELKVRNTGDKTIQTLTWEYVFFEPGTEREVGRQQFTSRVSIRPGGTRTVTMRSGTPPTGTIDASNAGKKSRDQYSEQIVIQRVGYADGSVWQTAVHKP
jgi:hypothetical protein